MARGKVVEFDYYEFGKLLRRAIQAVCEGRDPGDLTTIEDPAALQQIKDLVGAERISRFVPPNPRFVARPPRAAAQGRHKLHFDRSTPSRFGVLPRYGDGSQIKWFEASPCYIYHVVNAWEDGDEVVLDVCRVRRPQPRADDLLCSWFYIRRQVADNESLISDVAGAKRPLRPSRIWP